MKTRNVILQTLTAFCATGLFTVAVAQTTGGGMSADTNEPPEMNAPEPNESAADMSADQSDNATPKDQQTLLPAKDQTTTMPSNVGPKPAEAQGSNPDAQTLLTPPAEVTGTNPDQLRLNFHNAPLEMVLHYLSDAAGFIIVMDTTVHGNVSVISDHPMTRDEAVDLLNSVLNQNGYAAVRDGRTLTIMDKNDAKTRNIPVKSANNPSDIPANDEIATYIIPLRYVEAKQLVTDLSSFVSPQATIVANDAANSIVITDTQANIRHLDEIIKAIDDSAQGETEIRVFHLQYANPTDVATELGQIFPSNGSDNGQTQSPIRFGGGGRGGGPGGFFARMMAANAGGNNQNAAIQKQSQVIAVADLRTSSVIVTASQDLMVQIAGMMEQLDVTSTRDQKVYVFHMNNGDPQQAVQVLQNMFQSTGTSRGGGTTGTSSSEESALMQREQNNATTTSSSSSTTSSSFTGGSRTGGGGAQ